MLDIDLPETRHGSARHAIRLEKINLAGGERRVWQELEQPSLDLGHCKRHRHEQPPLANDAQREADQLAQRVHPRAGKLVGPTDGSGVGKYAGHGLRHVFHIDWLQTRSTAADQRQHRQ
jgi:hypothetical protein